LQCSLLSRGGDVTDKHITLLMNAGLLVSNFLFIVLRSLSQVVWLYLYHLFSCLSISTPSMKIKWSIFSLPILTNCILLFMLDSFFLPDSPTYWSKYLLVFYSKNWPHIERPIPGLCTLIYIFSSCFTKLPTWTSFTIWVSCVVQGRKEILSLLNRRKYKEMLLSSLENTKLRLSPLDTRFLLRDLIGSGHIKTVQTPTGLLARISRDW